MVDVREMRSSEENIRAKERCGIRGVEKKKHIWMLNILSKNPVFLG
jgi:hypothetical protein